jgi:hypothetical protein
MTRRLRGGTVGPRMRPADPAERSGCVSGPSLRSIRSMIRTHYSVRIVQQIFEGLYEFSYLPDPVRVIPNTAVALPEIADGRQTLDDLGCGRGFASPTILRSVEAARACRSRLRLFAERWLDPTLKAGGDAVLTDLIVGARPGRTPRASPARAFDYDAPIAGLRAVDRYTLESRLTDVDYTLLERLASWRALAVAREVIEARRPRHVDGAGRHRPYRLKEWKRGSRIVLEANPDYRPLQFPDAIDRRSPNYADRHEGRQAAGGRPRRAVDHRGRTARAARVREGRFRLRAARRQRVEAPAAGRQAQAEYRARGIRHVRYAVPALLYTYFNLDDPVVGGNAQEKIALRRAIGLGFNTRSSSRRAGRRRHSRDATVAAGRRRLRCRRRRTHARTIRPRRARCSTASATWIATATATASSRRSPRALTQNGDARDAVARNRQPVDHEHEGHRAPDDDQQRAVRRAAEAGERRPAPGFDLGYRSPSPSGFAILATLWGRRSPDTNHSHFRNRRLRRRLRAVPAHAAGTGKERDRDAGCPTLLVAYAPIVYRSYTVGNAFMQPWVKGYYPSNFAFNWKYVDLDLDRKRAPRKARHPMALSSTPSIRRTGERSASPWRKWRFPIPSSVVDIGRTAVRAGISEDQPERQDPGDRRSGRTQRKPSACSNPAPS